MAGVNKEQAPIPVVEVGRHPEPGELTGELASHVQVTPTAIQVPDDLGQMGVQAVGQGVAISGQPPVVIPLTEEEMQLGLRVSWMSRAQESLYWLARWCLRLVKMAKEHGRNVIFGK